MIPRTEWEVLISDVLAEIAAGATTFALYGPSHPRAQDAVAKLIADLGFLLKDEAEIAVVLLGEELFVQDRPFTRTARQVPAVIRRFRKRGLEHATFRAGVTDAEIRSFLEELAATDETPVRSRAHLQVGRVELGEAEVEPGTAAAGKGHVLPTLQDRVTLLHETFAAFAGGYSLAVGNLEVVARSVHHVLGAGPEVLRHFAPWQGEERWAAVHAHNTCVLAQALARPAGVGAGTCTELGMAALVHDIAKVFLPAEVRARDLDLTSPDEIELVLDHPAAGLAALLGADQLPVLALIVSYEHHLSYNGTGYPRLPRPRRPHPASRLVSVADAFVTLYSAPGARGLATSEAVLSWIGERAGSLFDPSWCLALLSVVAASTPGAESQPLG